MLVVVALRLKSTTILNPCPSSPSHPPGLKDLIYCNPILNSKYIEASASTKEVRTVIVVAAAAVVVVVVVVMRHGIE